MFAVIFEFKYIFTYSALIIKWCGYSVKIHIALIVSPSILVLLYFHFLVLSFLFLSVLILSYNHPFISKIYLLALSSKLECIFSSSIIFFETFFTIFENSLSLSLCSSTEYVFTPPLFSAYLLYTLKISLL